MTTGHALAGWVPYGIRCNADRHVVDWCHLGEAAFASPFFDQTIDSALGKPFNQLFAHTTPIEALLDWHHARPGLTPAAFLFHGSRCGSTLFAQMARAAPRTIVISEAPPIDQVLGAGVPDTDRIEWLRALLSALGQPRRGDEQHLFVKFDAWHVMELALVQRAFPGVPCVFLYREPAAVIASQMRTPSLFIERARVDGVALSSEALSASHLERREERCGQVLGALYAAAREHAACGAVMLMNYAELPEAAVSYVIQCRPFDDHDAVRARLRHVAEFDAKTPSLPFDTIEGSPRRPPSEGALRTATRFVAPVYLELEAIRRSQYGVP